MGWRYLYYTSGAFVFVLSVARVTVLRFNETPKYLLCKGMDEEVVKTLQDLATKHNRSCSLTVEQLEQCGSITTAHAKAKFSVSEILVHYRGLFATRTLGYSTCLLWFSWSLIGIVSTYLAKPNGPSTNILQGISALLHVFTSLSCQQRGRFWRDAALYHMEELYTGSILRHFWSTCRSISFESASYWEEVLYGHWCSPDKYDFVSLPYEVLVANLQAVAFFFAYTAVRSAAQNVAFSCIVSFAINIYFSVLYAYSPEVRYCEAPQGQLLLPCTGIGCY